MSTRPASHMTQAERRAATRTALLDATIECLVAFGYANVTTGRVAELAGLSRGAQVNYFPTKAALVSAAVSHLAAKRIDELRALIEPPPTAGDRMGALLDLLWQAVEGDLFDATLELWIAARTDGDLREELLALEREVASAAIRLAIDAMPDLGDRPTLPDDLEFALATVRGLALRRAANGGDPRSVARAWRASHERLLRALA
ncbi:TetR/AcrR family transcriptional regulator [Patulibacter defluvii]|uniref:TetR/AcrR family transcriptional regulator n=1 Tax=Patulibacter defluvii TaxID=3095358 RepID=UPI002A754B33|nr:TetR/AcrR family transcriptional regulator [Patulibacter sp. DM4]